MSYWSNIFDIIYKTMVLILLSIAVALLWNIRSRQQVFPTFGDLERAAKSGDTPAEMEKILDMPAVHVRGGNLDRVNNVIEATNVGTVKEVIAVKYLNSPGK
jgi:hypothetical protein